MTRTRRNPAFLNAPQLLSEMQRKEPLQVLEDFFSVYHLSQAKDIATDLFHVAVSTENYQFGTPLERAGVVSFHEHLHLLLEAAYECMKRSAIKLPKSVLKHSSTIHLKVCANLVGC
jgi:hypothetical protein